MKYKTNSLIVTIELKNGKSLEREFKPNKMSYEKLGFLRKKERLRIRSYDSIEIKEEDNRQYVQRFINDLDDFVIWCDNSTFKKEEIENVKVSPKIIEQDAYLF